MATLQEAKNQGIKTREGQLIYRRAVEASGRIQKEIAKYTNDGLLEVDELASKERRKVERLIEEDQKVLGEGMRQAMALNPKPRQKSTTVKRRR